MSNYITTNDPTGKAVFSSAVPVAHHTHRLGEGPKSTGWDLLYTTNSATPVINGSETDLLEYRKDRVEGIPPITHPAGSSVALIIMPRDATSPMHRTLTLDIDYVIEGSVRLELDSGETQILHKGDSVVMRATNHKWTNITEEGDGVLKMVCFAQSLEAKVEIGDLVLDRFGLDGPPAEE